MFIGKYSKPMGESMHCVLPCESLRIAESTWRVAEGYHFAFCSSVLSLEEKDQVDQKKEQSTHRREVLQSITMSPNDQEHGDVEGWCKTAMNYTKGESPSKSVILTYVAEWSTAK
ncbi:hypothetical protein H5410_001988 [Solanum commersonii]|uniref:Uncharacterized protein n=1 Tax=Solanum commersonii TaxID=4109 RepID=A0A9J6B1M3_SOLCO|nr:hypothetical protein H5410_001988 [Solanum commersonii]